MLVIDAVEVSTSGGHLVALGLQAAAPYSLAGDARDVVEDVHRLGGLAVLAHPDSPREEFRWRAVGAPYDGFEWMNADSEWRDETPGRLLGSALRGLVRGPETIAELFSKSARSFARWDGRGDGRRRTHAFGIAALDAHARIGWEDAGEEPRQWTFLARPTYEQMFRALAQVVELDRPPTGRATDDAPRVLAALAAGRTYSITRAIAGPATLRFTAEQGGRTIPMGGSLEPGPAVFHAEVTDASDAAVVLLRNGREVAAASGALRAQQDAELGGVYRVEVTLGERAFPWLVSNPIYVGAEPERSAEGPAPTGTPASRLQPFSTYDDWRIEREPSSTSSLSTDRATMTLRWRFALGPGRPAGQFAALSVPIESQDGYESVQFDARASRPLRMSFQVRLPGPSDSQRWGRSIYLDEQLRRIVIRLEDLEPIGRTSTLRPVVARIRSLLFVIDTVNTLPGSDGEIVLSNVALGLGDTGGGG